MSWPKILPDTLALMTTMSKEEIGLGILDMRKLTTISPVTQGDDIHYHLANTPAREYYFVCLSCSWTTSPVM